VFKPRRGLTRQRSPGQRSSHAWCAPHPRQTGEPSAAAANIRPAATCSTPSGYKSPQHRSFLPFPPSFSSTPRTTAMTTRRWLAADSTHHSSILSAQSTTKVSRSFYPCRCSSSSPPLTSVTRSHAHPPPHTGELLLLASRCWQLALTGSSCPPCVRAAGRPNRRPSTPPLDGFPSHRRRSPPSRGPHW
jgi:hypothetical protein